LIVLGDDAEGLTEHAAGGIDLGQGELHTFVGALAEGSLRAG
jgi:hypothetical protein